MRSDITRFAKSLGAPEGPGPHQQSEAGLRLFQETRAKPFANDGHVIAASRGRRANQAQENSARAGQAARALEAADTLRQRARQGADAIVAGPDRSGDRAADAIGGTGAAARGRHCAVGSAGRWTRRHWPRGRFAGWRRYRRRRWIAGRAADCLSAAGNQTAGCSRAGTRHLGDDAAWLRTYGLASPAPHGPDALGGLGFPATLKLPQRRRSIQ